MKIQNILIFQNLDSWGGGGGGLGLKPNKACFIMCRDLRVHVLRALNGCQIEQRIFICFLVQIYRILPVTLQLQGRFLIFLRHTVLKIPNSYFQMLAGMRLL